jgi:hypothetical protein
MLLSGTKDDFSSRMLGAINGMMLDMLAAIARKDYEDRRRRQAEGQAKAKAEGKYRGRPEDTKRHASIAAMLGKGLSWSEIQRRAPPVAGGPSCRRSPRKCERRLSVVRAETLESRRQAHRTRADDQADRF